jgi:3'(2'), 5'-bisphosphate nucleotidase
MTEENVSEFLPVVRELALQAGKRLIELSRTELVRERKADRTLVTNADRAANEIILTGLRKSFPSHRILSEETGLEGPAGADLVWMVDPLDGTKAYARNAPGYSVMIGLLGGGRPVLGVVFDPLENVLYEAARGHGCVCEENGRRVAVRVSDRDDPSAMPVITSTDVPPKLSSLLRDAFPAPLLEPLNSVGVKVGYLVRRRADIYVNHHPIHYWDSCAPLAILEEAGGRMTDWKGRPLEYPMNGSHRHGGPTLATNGHRHEELLTLLSRLK